MKLNNKACQGACAVLLLLAAGATQAAITSYAAELTADGWPSAEGGPARGNASIALDDSTNELSWEIEWAGTPARRAEVTVRKPDSAPLVDGPLVLDLAVGESSGDVRGGELSGSVQLTPRQAEELAGDDWQVEVRLLDKRGMRLTGKLERQQLPPGVWL
ncbi:MAG: CHRD domain-containing protein [Pseudomonadota bacterium]